MRVRQSWLVFPAEKRSAMMDGTQAPIPYTSEEIALDRALHILGVSAGAFGSIVLIFTAGLDGGKSWPIVAYSACLVAMLGSSAAYNLCKNALRRPMLRRFDHAAIFLMIAGTYTPFTTRILPACLGMLLTGSVWGFALSGAVLKLLCPHRLERVGLLLYLALGWMVLIAWEPFRAIVDSATASLILSGGILYTVGAVFHVARRLPFHKAIWHAFVLVAACCHYAAVLRSMKAI